MESLKVDATEILHDLGASVVIDEDIDTGTMEFGGETYVPASPAHVSVSVSNTGSGLVALGTIAASYHAECSRCLAPFTLELVGEVEGFYTTRELAKELSEDQEWEPMGEGIIDLEHALESAVRIELPFAPVHAEDCAGICPVCGCDRNETACECDTQVPKPGPFDSLKDIFEESPGEWL